MKSINCPVCANPLSITVAKGRQSHKPFIMLKCDTDGRHFRGFITDQSYVKRVMDDVKQNTGMGTGIAGSESLLGKPCISTDNRGRSDDAAPA
jgi:hypothetical protein